MKKWVQLTTGAMLGLLLGRLLGFPEFAGLCKIIASCGFLMTAISAGATQGVFGRLIFAGLIFSWFGDAFLIGTTEHMFQLGLVSFFLAHVLYCVAFRVHGVSLKWATGTLICLVPVLVVLFIFIWPYVPPAMSRPVLAYALVITLMVSLAGGTRGAHGPPSVFIGALMFYFSDLSVAIGQFVDPQSLSYLWGLPLYYLGQLFLASSIREIPPVVALNR